MKSLRSFLRCTAGAAAAEMALVLPFLIVLLFGGAELATYFYYEHQVVKGVRDGARFAGRQAFSSINCGGSAIPSDVEDAIVEITRTGQISGGTERVPGWSEDDVTVTVSCPATAVTTGIYQNETNAPRVSVAANVAYRSLFNGLGVIDDTYFLRASQQSAVVGL